MMEERLRAVEKQLAVLTERVEQYTETTNKLLEQHDVTLYGSNGTNGLRLKVDRLEQADKDKKRWIGYIVAVVGTILAKLVADVVGFFK